MLFSVFKHYLELYITDTVLKVSRSLYFFTTSISHDVENYFPTVALLHIFKDMRFGNYHLLVTTFVKHI